MEIVMFEDIKWLFFDVGSTLVDESRARERRFFEIAKAANVPYQEVYDKALKLYAQNLKGDWETARAFGVELPKWHKEDEILYPDSAACLERLSRKYKIGVIANQSPGTKDRLKAHGILRYIDWVVASAEEGVAKPDKRIFSVALERSCCHPQNAVMIGDRLDNDIAPAKSIGMRTIWVRQGFYQFWNVSAPDEKPDYTVDSLIDLCTVL